MLEKPSLITSGQFEDPRGKLSFFNDFDMKEVRRFYMIEHPDTSIVRAWQAHKKEQKWFYVIAGSFKVVILQPEEWTTNLQKSIPEEFILNSADNKILHVPGMFANGFKALEPHSKLIVFSDFPISEAGADDYRYDKSLWYNWN